MFRRVAVLVVLLALAGATVPASPVQVSYVYSDSMEPTIGTNDGYLLVPSDGVESGDVVTFWSPQRGEYATHRVVGRTDDGFVTRGDNNQVTDQAAGYSPVTREEITGEVLALGGDPVVIPGLGHVVAVVASNRLLVLLGAAVLLLAGFDGSDDGTPERPVVRSSDLLVPLLVAAVVGSVLMVSVGATHKSMTYVAVTDGGTGVSTVAVGEPTNETVIVESESIPLTRRVVDVDGMTVTDATRNGSAVVLETRVPPPSTTGPHRTDVAVYRYPAVLPAGVQRWLQGIHPALASGVSTGALFAPFVVLYLLLVDGAAPLRRRTRRTRRSGR